MALRFFVGNSGAGKSYTLYSKVLEEAEKHPDRQYIVLVPEQFTLQTQKSFVEMSSRHGIWNIDILSFDRLAYRVMDETGTGNLPVLDEIGKIFLVRRAAQEQKDKLVFMRTYLTRIGYINEVKSMISEFIQYDVTQEKITELLEQNRERQQVYGKLHDLQLIYQAFLDNLKETYRTQEGLLDVLYQVAERSAFLRGATLVLDGFTGFTPVQKRLMEKLMGICRDVWITLTYDTTEPVREVLPDYHLFHMSAKMYRALRATAAKLALFTEEDVILPAQDNFRLKDNPALASLERNLFRSRRQVYEKEQEAVSIHLCKNPLEEVDFAARTIRRLVAQEGFRYRDIAIVTGELEGYGEYAQRIFPRYGIPFFSDYKRNALVNPAIACIRGLMECALKDFTYESVSRLWRTGLLPIEQEKLDVMQNYILARGIRGRKRWSEEWTRLTSGMEEEELEELNRCREAFIEPLLPFSKVLRSKRTNVREKTEAVCGLMEAYDMQQQLEQYAQTFLDEGEAALGKEYSQMYGVVIQILDRLVELLGDEIMEGEEYARLLEAGFAETKVGIIPPGVDEVTIGDIERSRLKPVKVLFFLGVNDGIIPRNKSCAGILSELEREHLREQGMELSPGREEQYYNQRFYLYLNLTKPTHKLYLSYSRVDAKGSAINPSYLLKTIQELFLHIPRVDEELYKSQAEAVAAPVNAMDYVIEQLYAENKQEEFYSLYRWLSGTGPYAARLENLKKASGDGRDSDKLHAALAKAVYTNELSGSVTRLERYAACAYAHFLQYGIGAGEREEYGFRSLDFGTMIHEVLDAYAKELKKRHLSWTGVSEELQEELIEKCLMEAVQDSDASVLYYTARDQYRIVRMRRILKRTIWALTKQLSEGTFVPSGYELQFQDTRPIKNGLEEAARMNLRGRIDRMDICEQEDKVYVKVLDYKTGRQQFKLLNLYYGTQLQLIVYLQAALRFEKELHRDKEVLPAGIVYYQVEDPLVEKEEDGQVQERILKQLNVDGIFCDSQEVLEALDRNLAEGGADYNSSVVPVALKKDGTLAQKSKTVSGEELQLMMDYADQKIRDMGENILQGDIRLNPYVDGTISSCSYCGYQSVCMQKQGGRPMEYRSLKKLDETEIYLRMKQEVEGVKRTDGSEMDGTAAAGH